MTNIRMINQGSAVRDWQKLMWDLTMPIHKNMAADGLIDLYSTTRPSKPWILLRPKKIICVFRVTSVKKFGSVGRKMFLF